MLGKVSVGEHWIGGYFRHTLDPKFNWLELLLLYKRASEKILIPTNKFEIIYFNNKLCNRSVWTISRIKGSIILTNVLVSISRKGMVLEYFDKKQRERKKYTNSSRRCDRRHSFVIDSLSPFLSSTPVTEKGINRVRCSYPCCSFTSGTQRFRNSRASPSMQNRKT